MEFTHRAVPEPLRGRLEAYLNQRCVKKKIPESSQPISSSPPLTPRLEDERPNQPSDKSNEQPSETGSTQPRLSDVKTSNNPKTAALLNASRTLGGLSEKSCRRALPLIPDPLHSHRSRSGESLKLRVTFSRGCVPSLRQILF